METTARPSETPRDLTDVDAADATPDASAKRKRQPRNSACQSCAVRMCRCQDLRVRRLMNPCYSPGPEDEMHCLYRRRYL
jgi:hypothetical protein